MRVTKANDKLDRLRQACVKLKERRDERGRTKLAPARASTGTAGPPTIPPPWRPADRRRGADSRAASSSRGPTTIPPPWRAARTPPPGADGREHDLGLRLRRRLRRERQRREARLPDARQDRRRHLRHARRAGDCFVLQRCGFIHWLLTALSSSALENFRPFGRIPARRRALPRRGWRRHGQPWAVEPFMRRPVYCRRDSLP